MKLKTLNFAKSKKIIGKWEILLKIIRTSLGNPIILLLINKKITVH